MAAATSSMDRRQTALRSTPVASIGSGDKKQRPDIGRTLEFTDAYVRARGSA